MKKPRSLRAVNVRLSKPLLKRRGHSGCSERAALQGSFPGASINETAAAAVYPWPTATAIVNDVHDHLRAGAVNDNIDEAAF